MSHHFPEGSLTSLVDMGKSDREVGLERICQVALSLKELLVRGGLLEPFNMPLICLDFG